MNEDEWLASMEPGSMVLFLAGRASDRKLRLFACACCRRLWDLMDPDSRQAIEVAERFADRLASLSELRSARRRLEALYRDEEGFNVTDEPALYVTDRSAGEAARCASAAVSRVIGFLAAPPGSTFYGPFSGPAESVAAMAAEEKEQVDLLRDLFGNPFRPVSVSTAWLTRSVVSLAQAAYEERILPGGTLDRVRLAVLADALEEAGCTDTELLGHLRGPGLHARGCFVLDAILGRE